MKFVVNIATAIASLTLSACAIAQTSPGGGSGNPSCPAQFTAAKIPANVNSLCDRLLAEFVPGVSRAILHPASTGTLGPGEQPETFEIPASTWQVNIRIHAPANHNLPWDYEDYPAFSGSGATGYWNGLDTTETTTGATVLSNNSLAGGYENFPSQILLNLKFSNWFINPTQINYEYKGSLQWRYPVYSMENGEMTGSIGSTPIPWSAGTFGRLVSG